MTDKHIQSEAKVPSKPESRSEKGSAAKAGARQHAGVADLDLNENGQAMIDVFARSTEAYVDWMTVWNREVSDFLARRLERQREFARKACACKDGAELVECQREWSVTAQQDYAEELQKLTELGLSFAERQMPDTKTGA